MSSKFFNCYYILVIYIFIIAFCNVIKGKILGLLGIRPTRRQLCPKQFCATLFKETRKQVAMVTRCFWPNFTSRCRWMRFSHWPQTVGAVVVLVKNVMVCLSFLHTVTVWVYLHTSNNLKKKKKDSAFLLVEQQSTLSLGRAFFNLESYSVTDLLESLWDKNPVCALFLVSWKPL